MGVSEIITCKKTSVSLNLSQSFTGKRFWLTSLPWCQPDRRGSCISHPLSAGEPAPRHLYFCSTRPQTRPSARRRSPAKPNRNCCPRYRSSTLYCYATSSAPHKAASGCRHRYRSRRNARPDGSKSRIWFNTELVNWNSSTSLITRIIQLFLDFIGRVSANKISFRRK